jgi:dihydroxy-acid dehydratase
LNDLWNGPGAAHRRVIYKGAGYSDDDIRTKPHIGIANTFTEASPAHAHLRSLADAVKQGVWESGGLPFEFGVPATCGNVAVGTEEMKYELAGRDVVAMSIEFVSRVHSFDGLVMLSSCDNIIPGQMLAAARLDVPSVLLTGGPMYPGMWRDRQVLTPDINVYGLSGMLPGEFEEMEDAACPGHGACAVMGTANTMQILSEVLGFSLPGTATIPAPTAARIRAARESGRVVVDLVRRGVRPSRMLKRGNILNAVVVDLAIGGSTNAVLHLLSLARDLGIDLSLDDFDELSDDIPCICAVRPSGPYTVVDLHQEGGVPAILRALSRRLHLDVCDVTGLTLAERLGRAQAGPGRPGAGASAGAGVVVKTLEDPVSASSGLSVLRGNLAPDGAIIRSSGVPSGMRRFSGPARVFHNDSEGFQAVERDEISPGDVMVIRYEGCRGAPGMKEIMLSTDAMVARGLDTSVGLVTDGRFSGFNHGPIVGHVSPEAMAGGPIALVENGDVITVDIEKKTLVLEVPGPEVHRRRAAWRPPAPKTTRGLLALYAATCRPAHEGGAMQNW